MTTGRLVSMGDGSSIWRMGAGFGTARVTTRNIGPFTRGLFRTAHLCGGGLSVDRLPPLTHVLGRLLLYSIHFQKNHGQKKMAFNDGPRVRDEPNPYSTPAGVQGLRCPGCTVSRVYGVQGLRSPGFTVSRVCPTWRGHRAGNDRHAAKRRSIPSRPVQVTSLEPS
jgi:hypothetical protein